MKEFIANHPHIFWLTFSSAYGTIGVLIGAIIRLKVSRHIARKHDGTRPRIECWCQEFFIGYEIAVVSMYTAFLTWPLTIALIAVWYASVAVSLPLTWVHDLYTQIHVREINKKL